MLFVVPFDGSPLAAAALSKAKLYAAALEELPDALRTPLFAGEPPELVAVSVVPENERYAREKGWIDDDEEFHSRTVAERLREQVTDIAPSAGFRTIRVDRGATSGTIGARLRSEAADLGATDVFIGSENAGRIVTPLDSVGGSLAADECFDVHLVRRRLPPRARERLRSEFFLP